MTIETGSLKSFQKYLRTTALGQVYEYHRVIGSTNTRALKLIQEGAQHGLVVLTDFQNDGRGTQGRNWSSRLGQNLTFSTILRTKLDPSQIPLIGLLAAIAVRDAIVGIDKMLDPKLKWPNDVLVSGRKCAGILLESSISSDADDRNQQIVLGLGLNVNQVDFPDALQDRATSLRLENGRLWPIELLLAEILNNLEGQLTLLSESVEDLLNPYREHLLGLGKEIEFLPSNSKTNSIQGILGGVNDKGGLQIKQGLDEKTYYSGSISKLGNLRFL